MIAYYVLTGVLSFFAGIFTGYFVFDSGQADLKKVEKICGSDSVCASYISCIIANTTSNPGGQNLRNCDVLAESIAAEKKASIMKNAWDFCAKNDDRNTAALCREYVRYGK